MTKKLPLMNNQLYPKIDTISKREAIIRLLVSMPRTERFR